MEVSKPYMNAQTVKAPSLSFLQHHVLLWITGMQKWLLVKSDNMDVVQ